MKKINFLTKTIPNHLTVAVSAWASKIIIALVQIVSIKILLNYLGEDKYAVYAIAYSLIGWLTLSDFGVGFSLQNFISESRAKNENYDKYIVAALQIMAVVLVFSVSVIVFISFPVQNIVFKRFSYILELQTVNIVLVVGIVALVSWFLNIVSKVYYALHKGYIANLIPTISIVISMIVLVVVDRYTRKQGSVLLALLVFTMPQLIIVLFAFIKVFKNYFSKLLKFNVSVLKALILRSVKFHGVMLFSLAYMQTDYLVMSQTLKANEIVEYNIFMRVFMFFSYAYVSFLAAFWPVSTQMYVNRKFKELKNAIKKYLTYSTLFTILGTIFVMLSYKIIINILAPRQNILPTFLFMLLLGIYIIVRAWSDTFTVLLQSVSAFRIFWICMPIQLVVNFLLQYFLSKVYGVEGIVLGLIISTAFISVWVLFLKTRKLLKQTIF
ncbi:MAG: MATE family efflux transporter [Endomicrobium sp.]|jgi:O-antigen/teichoic acid export membrane protein|nr:MATE family efflux transporter [Endomicrobium sp.]